MIVNRTGSELVFFALVNIVTKSVFRMTHIDAYRFQMEKKYHHHDGNEAVVPNGAPKSILVERSYVTRKLYNTTGI